MTVPVPCVQGAYCTLHFNLNSVGSHLSLVTIVTNLYGLSDITKSKRYEDEICM
jgi:hypothetical protein